MAEINAIAGELMPMTVVATAKSRSNFSLHHLFAACRYTNRIGEVEAENTGKEFAGFWDEILQNAMAVAMLSVACLEGFANELYFEGAAIKDSLNPPGAQLFGELIDTASILDKFDAALVIRKGSRMNRGDTVVQNIKALITLRNTIVHFRSEWYGEAGNHEKLSRLLNGKFKHSPFLQSEKTLFPHAWASHSFAVWAISSTAAFLEYFYSSADLPPPIGKEHKGQLSVLSAGVVYASVK